LHVRKHKQRSGDQPRAQRNLEPAKDAARHTAVSSHAREFGKISEDSSLFDCSILGEGLGGSVGTGLDESDTFEKAVDAGVLQGAFLGACDRHTVTTRSLPRGVPWC
jgi:hypothetical protein